jgi:salicylate hydroxylase
VVVRFFVLRRAYICLIRLAIAGLSTAIGLALSGHTVRVLEKSSRLEESIGGICLPPNVTNILVEWGLEEEIKKTASLVCEGPGSNLWDCKLFTVAYRLASTMLILSSDETGKLIGYLEWAELIIQDSGAKFYMMRVCPNPRAVTLG